jgi:hypothetical protein
LADFCARRQLDPLKRSAKQHRVAFGGTMSVGSSIRNSPPILGNCRRPTPPRSFPTPDRWQHR